MIRPIIFCKAPVVGRVKTRLQPDFTPEQAAAIHTAMARRVIARVLRLYSHAWLAADDPGHPFFRQFDMPLLIQGSGDLGDRMHRLARIAVDHGARGVLLLGTDSPHMSTARLRYAVHYLSYYDVVLGPVEDGGYDLLAMRGCPGGIFRAVRWGTSFVLADTLDRASGLGLACRCLSTGFDVDTKADLDRMLLKNGVPVF